MNRRSFFKGGLAALVLPGFLKGLPIAAAAPVEAATNFEFTGFMSSVPLCTSVSIICSGEGYTPVIG